MGVNGLWQVLQPCARPTNLATLNRQRLAVDASIWIYQFLKAVRDKEGHALRNAHVVGFFRRICKLLWFGILPVFVFDGGAPALKRATLQARRHRREGRRDDAVRTAGKLLAVQMQRMAEDEAERRRKQVRDRDGGGDGGDGDGDGIAAGEVLPSVDQVVYAEEAHMSQQERLQRRKFTKQDAYHLPELDPHALAGGGRPEDPRIMSIDELEAYARQFHAGEDINLYDFSKIDFDGEFFKSLPPPDRYNILNAARLRSRLRMGLSKEQLDTMFPDRMAFSRFQIERVRERNHLTQRLMLEVGMTGLDLTISGGGPGVGGVAGSSGLRVAGERDREYILVKNDGAEGGWALGVVSRDKDRGTVQDKPIDVDALQFRYQGDEGYDNQGNSDGENDDDDDDVEFEDVPIAGLNRLPKLPAVGSTMGDNDDGDDDALFVTSYDPPAAEAEAMETDDADVAGALSADEDEDLRRAIALSLQNQHGGANEEGEEEEEEADNDEGGDEEKRRAERPAPQWTQTAAETVRPIFGSTGKMVAHVVNNRASAAVAAAAKRARERAEQEAAAGGAGGSDNAIGDDIDSGDSGDSSDSELDLRAALARAAKRRKKQQQKAVVRPVQPQTKNPFDGPLPFEKLDWRTSIFEKKPTAVPAASSVPAATTTVNANAAESAAFEPDSEDELGGGFERVPDASASVSPSSPSPGDRTPEAAEKVSAEPRPLPPWMADDTDIRAAVRQQQQYDDAINAEDREMARQEAELWQYRQQQAKRVVEIDSSSDDDGGSDVEVLDAPPPPPKQQTPPPASAEPAGPAPAGPAPADAAETEEKPAPETRDSSPEMEFEDVQIPDGMAEEKARELQEQEPAAPDVSADATDAAISATATADDGLFTGDGDGDGDAHVSDFEFSDPEDEELLAQMAEEVEEHARFASTLNHQQAQRADPQSQQAYEQELRALRSQQKKDRRDADEVTQVMVSECQALLRLFGIPYITAPMEAEAQCAELVALGLVDGIVTDDSDTFLFGGTRVYKNMFNGNKFVECYLGADLAREMSLTRETLIALAQLLGSDYTDGLPGVGPVTAMEILSEFPGPDGLQAFRDWWTEVQTTGRLREGDATSAFRRKFRKAQGTKLFLPTGFPSPAVVDAYLHPEVDRSTEPFQWGVPDLDGLRTFLMATVGWSAERTDEVLVPVIRDMNRREAEGTQSNLTRYFTGTVGAGARLTEAQVREQQQQQQRRQQKKQQRQQQAQAQAQAFPDEDAPARPAPRNKGATSRRMAAAVSRLKASTTAAEAAASVMRASSATRAPASRKRKGRTAVAATDGADGVDGSDAGTLASHGDGDVDDIDDIDGDGDGDGNGDGDGDGDYTDAVARKARRGGKKTRSS